MTQAIVVWGCIPCDIEFKDEKEARAHYDKFREKGDKSHVSKIVKMIGVVQEVKWPPKGFKNKTKRSTKKRK